MESSCSCSSSSGSCSVTTKKLSTTNPWRAEEAIAGNAEALEAIRELITFPVHYSKQAQKLGLKERARHSCNFSANCVDGCQQAPVAVSFPCCRYCSDKQIEEFHRKLSSLFNEYMQNSSKTSPTTSSNPQDLNNDTLISQDGMDSVMEDFDSFDREDASTIAQKTQLELYLAEPRMERKKELDVLQFWKGNQCRYPELSSMARDLLAIPVSSVASEAAFSVGGRVINKFRSSLKPANVEALLCTRDWIYGKQFEMEVELEELCEDVMTMDGATVDGSRAT